jgi:predicted flap endonuclease-1-like 5' DNA nuclease
MALDAATGTISGTPTEPMGDTTFNLWANQTDGTSVRTTFLFEVLEDTDGDGMPDVLPDYYDSTTGGLVEDDDDDNDGVTDADEREAGTDPLDPDTDGDGICDGPVTPANSDCTTGSNNSGGSFFAKYLWCCWPILLLLLLLVVLLRDEERRETVLGVTGPMPGNTTAEPAFIGGWGLKDDPFVLRPVEGLASGGKVLSEEIITIKGISPGYLMGARDLRQGENGLRASMVNVKGTAKRGHEELPRMREIEVDETGDVQIRLHFQDHPGTKAGGEYRTEVKLGSASVYLQWAIRVDPSEEAAKEAAKEAEEEAAKEAEEEAAAAALLAKQEEEKAAKEAEEEAAAAALLAKQEEEKAAKEAEEEAAAAALLAKQEEEKAAKEAEEAAAAALLAKQEEEKAAKAAASKPSGKEEKKQEELRRVKERASTIDFETLGEASSSELKSAVEEGAETLEVASASEFADSGSARISDSSGTSVIAWTGKDGNLLTGVSGVTRTFAAASIVLVKDDLQAIKGIGPFLEEKLNALGITTYRQIANMDPELEEQVNEAIEFFPGRVKRDQWVTQAKILLGEDVKLDEKALKQTEELQRVAAKADSIDFATLGVATAADKDDLQTIKGIGPFIEEKLYALGIYTFSQISKMTPEIEEEVNVAIEFFPGRVKRDEWAKQAGEILRD